MYYSLLGVLLRLYMVLNFFTLNRLQEPALVSNTFFHYKKIKTFTIAILLADLICGGTFVSYDEKKVIIWDSSHHNIITSTRTTNPIPK